MAQKLKRMAIILLSLSINNPGKRKQGMAPHPQRPNLPALRTRPRVSRLPEGIHLLQIKIKSNLCQSCRNSHIFIPLIGKK
ncbi:hypothetical protein [Allofranklinella schreckenbergeri]|uniref:hypothetical protein n=1 Tax=Allofranklinella schreckenbergeri TaxID=1076744 RepID=UPI0011C37742|nr:hypothetical protein [Allofranklinella schreckenbergeri]